MNEIQIYADGACKGNPGPGGWGAWLQSGPHEKELWGGEPLTTNNRMELKAVIEALSALKKPSQVAMHVDSQYVRQGITTWIHQWKRRGWKTADHKPVKKRGLVAGSGGCPHPTSGAVALGQRSFRRPRQ